MREKISTLFAEKGTCSTYNNIREDKLCAAHDFVNSRHEMYQQFLDEDFPQKLKQNFYGAFWELRFVDWLAANKNLELLERRKEGADFIVCHNNQSIHLETTSVSAGRQCVKLQNENPQNNTIDSYADAVKERIRSAIRTKSERNVDKKETSNYHHWLEKELIQLQEPFVVAIDITRLHKLTQFTSFFTVLGMPNTLIGAVFPLGNYAIDIDRNTGKAAGNYYCQYKNELKKNNGSTVATDLFLKDEFSHISAIIISRTCPDREGKLYTDYMLIHNPMAQNPLPLGLFEANREIIADLQACTLTDLKGNQIGVG